MDTPESGALELSLIKAVNNHWTGLLDWTSGLDYWTDQFYHKIHTCGLKTPVQILLKPFHAPCIPIQCSANVQPMSANVQPMLSQCPTYALNIA